MYPYGSFENAVIILIILSGKSGLFRASETILRDKRAFSNAIATVKFGRNCV